MGVEGAGALEYWVLETSEDLSFVHTSCPDHSHSLSPPLPPP